MHARCSARIPGPRFLQKANPVSLSFTRPLAVIGFLVTSLLGAVRADAMVVDCGPNICFQYDETQSAVAVFGPPFRVGDTLEFLPPAAAAVAAGGSGPASLSATFVIDRIFSGLGNLAGLHLSVEGDHDATAGGSVGSHFGLQLFDNAGPGSGAVGVSHDATGDGSQPRIWRLEAATSPEELFAAPSADLRLQLTGILSASAEGAGAGAWIATKYIAISATAVPAPPAMALFLSAAAALAARTRRRSHPPAR